MEGVAISGRVFVLNYFCDCLKTKFRFCWRCRKNILEIRQWNTTTFNAALLTVCKGNDAPPFFENVSCRFHQKKKGNLCLSFIRNDFFSNLWHSSVKKIAIVSKAKAVLHLWFVKERNLFLWDVILVIKPFSCFFLLFQTYGKEENRKKNLISFLELRNSSLCREFGWGGTPVKLQRRCPEAVLSVNRNHTLEEKAKSVVDVAIFSANPKRASVA